MGSTSTNISTVTKEDFVYNEPTLPSHLVPSSVVVCSTLFLVCVVIGGIFVVYKYWDKITMWMLLKKQSLKRKRSNNNDVEEEPEKLREDSVVLHDVEFPIDAFDNSNEVCQETRVKTKPQPSPSLFHDDQFLQEVLTSVAEICPDRIGNDSSNHDSNDETNKEAIMVDILDEIIEPLKSQQTNEIDERRFSGPALQRNKSYQDAIDCGVDFDIVSSGDVERMINSHSSISYPTLLDNCVLNENCNLNEVFDNESLSNILPELDSQELEENADDLTINSPRPFLSEPRAKSWLSGACKWQSTPIIDSAEDDNEANSTDLSLSRKMSSSVDDDQMLQVCNQYSPVYKLSFHSIQNRSNASLMVNYNEAELVNSSKIDD